MGKNEKFISEKEAKLVMGISNNLKKDGSGPTNRPSTLPHFKPGKSYFYPSVKIHKLNRDELKPGVSPPIRLITASQDGISKHSDVFLAKKWLKDLEKDFCKDLLIDSMDALNWLENVNTENERNSRCNFKGFTFDFKSLYDSINPNLVNEALDFAMKQCRKEWSPNFCKWILDLVKLSLKSSVGLFDGNWYKQIIGIPTGGSICVQIANIVVFYVMQKQIYSDKALMQHVVCIKRYIDDGAGFYIGSEEQFSAFFKTVNDKLKDYGLYIDESNLGENGIFVPFLDIRFCFDKEGILQTDLFQKETDSRAYLEFGSAHPNHVFSGIVYSQCLRLRRIINNNERLKTRLDELKKSFIIAKYPTNMVNNISDKVLRMERDIKTKQNKQRENKTPIQITSTYGCDSEIVSVAKKFEPYLLRTTSFKNNDGNNKLFHFVKKTGPSLSNKLVKLKELAVGPNCGQTVKCKSKNCKCCKMICEDQHVKINNKKAICAQGNCDSYNIVYQFTCKVCQETYIGRSTRKLRQRVLEHRNAFYDVLKGNKVNFDDDVFSLGMHLYEHGFHNKTDFENKYTISILANCSPLILETKEHKFIHRYKTLRPNGINTQNTFKLPLLY